MKNFKKVLALVLAVVMLLSFATVASAVTSDYYKDADDIDYSEAVDVLGLIGVLNGYPDDTFRPEATITRAEAAKIIAMFDNGSSSINGLYTSANPFSDCVGHWAESYIAYGAKTGIIAGIGGDKFAPESNVTGVQFLKMALVVLGYDAKTEGLEGKNWDVNTLALAKRVGLTATLGVSFDYSADLKREEAAVIMLDALCADVVEYGSKLAYNTTPTTIWPYVANGSVYWTVTGAVSTGKQLMSEWGLTQGYYEDAFMRPYYTWTKGSTTLYYMYPVKAEYKTYADLCTVYTDLGVAKTNYSKQLTIHHYVNGSAVADPTNNHHSIGTPCALYGEGVGSQGTLTQVFLMDDGTYRVTEIETWLGRVKSVSTTTSNRDGHLITDKAVTIDVAADDCNLGTADAVEVAIYSDAYKKGDWVLINYSTKTDSAGNVAGLQNVTSAKVETAKFTGIAAGATKVGADWKSDAEHFYIGNTGTPYGAGFPMIDGMPRLKLPTNLNGTYNFIYDTYGNVIGMVETAAAPYDYMVIDWMYMTANTGAAVLNANVVGLDAQMTNAVSIATLDGNTPNHWVTGTMTQYGPEYGANWSGRYDKLYTYQTDGDGNYYATTANGAKETDVSIINNKANLYVNGVLSNSYILTDNTQILVHEMDGTYTAATGANVGTIYAANAEIIADGNGIVSIIYLYGSYVFRESSKTTGFVAAGVSEPPVVEVIDGLKVTKLNVYFGGELKQIYVESDAWEEVLYNGNGFYTFRFIGQLSDGAMLCDVADYNAAASTQYEVTYLSGNTMVVSTGAAFKVAADVTIYDVYGGTVTTVTELTDNTVMLGFNGAGVVTTIYCLVSYYD